MENKTVLSIDEIRALPKAAIARKYSCSVQYVRKILSGKSETNSQRSRLIERDALDILQILERETPPIIHS